MKQKEKFSTSKRIKSFVFAFNGLKILFKEEHNARIHLVAAVVVVSLGVTYKVSNLEWLALLFSIGFVFTAEIVNSAIEDLCDFISKEKNDRIKKIKDLAAACVLVSALTALGIGLIVFIPKIIEQ